MNIDALLTEADPARDIRIPDPVVLDARAIVDSTDVALDRTHPRGLKVPTRHGVRWQPRRRVRWIVGPSIVAVALLAVLAVTISISLRHHGSPAATTVPASASVTPGVWNLAGYITQSGWQENSNAGPLPTSQQGTSQLTCPTLTTCYSIGEDNLSTQTQGVISVTRDGGATWHLSLAPDNDTYFWGISCPSSQTCMTVGDVPNATSQPSMYTTTNGGQSWSALPLPGHHDVTLSMSCSTTLECAVIGQEEASTSATSVGYFTSDGGLNWRDAVLPSGFAPSGTAQSAIDCFANGNCVATGSFVSGQQSSGTPVGLVYSVNGGASWSLSATPSTQGSGLLTCTNDEHCLVLELSGKFLSTSGELVTTDGGVTWTAVSASGLTSVNPATPMVFDSISCPTTSDCWASAHILESTCEGTCPYVPVQAEILSSSDGGVTWVNETLPAPPESSLQYADVFPLYCVSDANCRAVGSLELTQAASNAGLSPVQQDVMLTLEGANPPSADSGPSTTTGE